MTLRNFDAILLTSKKEPYQFATSFDEAGRVKTTSAMTQREIIVNSLGQGPLNATGNPEPITQNQKREMYNLANKLEAGGNVDILANEATLIEQCIKHLMPLIWGQLDDALNRDLS